MTERPCADPGCGEPTTNDSGYCRDCGIQRHLDSMQSGCQRMRYRERDGSVLDQLTAIGEALWGERCACPEPRPPSVLEARDPRNDR